MCSNKTPANLSHFPTFTLFLLGCIRAHYRQQLISSNELTVHTTTTYTSLMRKITKTSTNQVLHSLPIFYPPRDRRLRDTTSETKVAFDSHGIRERKSFLRKRPKRLRYHVTLTHSMTNKIIHKKWETPKDTVSLDKLYNHHKVLIFARFKLY